MLKAAGRSHDVNPDYSRDWRPRSKPVQSSAATDLHLCSSPAETVSQSPNMHKCHSERQRRISHFLRYQKQILRLSPQDDIATQSRNAGEDEGGGLNGLNVLNAILSLIG
jgi:hypothetical protein